MCVAVMNREGTLVMTFDPKRFLMIVVALGVFFVRC